MRNAFLFLFTITILTSITRVSLAVTDDDSELRSKKAYYTISTIIYDSPTISYLEGIDYQQSGIEISKTNFINLIPRMNTSLSHLAQKPELNGRVRAFIKANNLQVHMIGAHSLKAAQDLFINVLILNEFQKSIVSRGDLQVFGKDTINNLNMAIYELIRQNLNVAKTNLERVLVGDAGQRMKENFLSLGLNYRPVASASDQWLNQMAGRDPLYVVPQQPQTVLDKLSTKYMQTTSKKLKQSESPSLCSAMFS